MLCNMTYSKVKENGSECDIDKTKYCTMYNWTYRVSVTRLLLYGNGKGGEGAEGEKEEEWERGRDKEEGDREEGWREEGWREEGGGKDRERGEGSGDEGLVKWE
jgi:hypothetical protein